MLDKDTIMGLYLVQETFKPEAWNFFLENPGAAEGWRAGKTIVR